MGLASKVAAGACLFVCACGGGSDPSEAETGRSSSDLSLCLSHSVHVVDQPGPTQGLFRGTDTTATAPSIATNAEFVFVFDRSVDVDDVANGVTLSLTSCPNQPNPPAHRVPVTSVKTVSWQDNVVTLRHTEAFTPGCTYTLALSSTTPVGLGQCLDKATSFSFRVRDRHEQTPLPREASSVRYRPKQLDVAAFSESSIAIAPESVAQRYAEDLSVRPYVDTFALDGTVPRPSAYKAYAQSYLGVPVPGYGFIFRTDTNGKVRAAVDHIARGISLDPHPLVLESAAVIVATNSVLKTQKFQLLPILVATKDTLVVVSATQPPSPPNFRLAWNVNLQDQISKATFSVLVDARTGAVLQQALPGVQKQCRNLETLSLATNGTESGSVSIDPQTTLLSDPSDVRMTGYASNGTDVHGLALPAGQASLRTGQPAITIPAISAQCVGAFLGTTTTVATVPTTTTDASWSTEVTSTAGSYMAVQRSLEYWATHSLQGATGGQQGWIGFDGAGQTPIRVYVEPPTPVGNHYEPSDKSLHFVLTTQATAGTLSAGPGAALDTTGHEFAHGVLASFFPASSGLEFGAIKEALGDVAGATVEHWIRGDNIGVWCHGGDLSADKADPSDAKHVQYCIRDLSAPARSYEDLTATPPVLTPSPSTYGDGNYYAGTDSDTFVHLNSTVVSHWFNVVLTGGSGENSNKCPYDLGTPKLSWDDAFALLFQAIHLQLPLDGTINDLANGTVSMADALYTGDPLHDDKVGSVVDAWAAVGVWENFWEGRNSTIAPGPKATDVSPWAPLEWQVDTGINAQSSSWEVEISTDQTFTQQPSYQPPTTVTETVTGSGHTYGILRVALAPNTPYFWRERPVLGTPVPWNCVPVHAFTTGDTPIVRNLKITDTVVTDGSVRPGTMQVEWDTVPGATQYTLYVGNPDPTCASGTGVISVPVTGDPTKLFQTALVSGTLPNTTYTLDAQATGPNPPSGSPPTSTCTGIGFKTTAMRAPVMTDPENEFPFKYESPHTPYGRDVHPSWKAYDGAKKIQLSYFARSAAGGCPPAGTPPDHTETVDAACPSSIDNECPGTFTGDAFPTTAPPGPWANPTGYCWTVSAISGDPADQKPVPSTDPMRTFTYVLTFDLAEFQTQATPGIQIGRVEAAPKANPGVLSPGKYGDSVTLSWPAAPLANDYYVQIGHWPWGMTQTPLVPTNCLGAACTGGPAGGSTLSGTPPPDSQLVKGATSVTIPGDEAGKGRYCWMVWPVLENPSKISDPADPQPFVDPDASNIRCYTTETATPVIRVDNQPSGAGFSSAPITGTITFDYLPGVAGADPVLDVTATKNGASVSVSGKATANDKCTTPTTVDDRASWVAGDDFLFPDRYGCAYTFTFTPERSTTYTITASAKGYNTTATATPVTFTTGSCGGDGEECCDASVGSPCDAADHICAAGRCVACGKVGEPCCDKSVCNADGVCDGKNCIACGGSTQPCCAGNKCDSDRDNCSANKCTACGATGQPCCTHGSQCTSSADVCTGTVCEVGTKCNSEVHQGSDNPESHTIQLGTGHSSGTVVLTLNTFVVPDDMVVTYEGKVLWDSGCYGTATTVNGCLPDGNYPGVQVCCDGNGTGVCHATIPYSGSSTEMLVEVSPNCSGTEDTQWSFTLSCP